MATFTHYLPSIDELASRGWTVIYDEDAEDAVAIRSVIRKWDELTWAKQTYYRAKYGFDESGVLDISLPLVKVAPGARIGCFYPDTGADFGEFPTPDVSIQGSDNRLKAILEKSRIAVQRNRYDDSALTHVGPDSTLILTNAAGWGPPLTEPYGYAELDDRYICIWEFSLDTWGAEAPLWADPDDYEHCTFWYGDP